MEIYRVTKDSPKWQFHAYNYVRTDAFCFGQNIPVETEFLGDGGEEDFHGVLIIEDHKPVAGLRIAFPRPGIGKIERVCTIREKQKSGYGRIMIEEAEKWIAEKGISHVVISAQDRARGFYEKCGYVYNPNVSPNEYDVHAKNRPPRPKRPDGFKPDFVCVLVEKYLDSYQKAGGKGLICIPSGNHDMARLAKYVKGDRLKLAFAFLLTMPGAPFIYYGDEIGMPYVEKLFSVEGGYDRTGARSPMLWDRTPNAGFSSAPKEELYIPQPELADVSTAADQMEDRDSLRSEIQRLISIRQAHKALQSRGEIEFVHAREGVYPLAYLRFSGEERYLVVINPSDREEAFTGKFLLGDAVYTFGGRVKQQRGKVHVDPCTAGIYEIQPWVVV